MLLDKEEVMAFLPHRDPFLFVDEIEYIRGKEPNITLKKIVGVEVKAHYYTNPHHPIFAGHFPGNPILPGVVQIEMMGQAACFAVSRLQEQPFGKINVALMGINNAKFRKPILPEMHLVIKSVCVKARGNVMNFECEIYHNDELMSEGSILAVLNSEE